MNDPEPRSWTELAQTARQSRPPVIDVRTQVLAALTPLQPAPAPVPMTDLLLDGCRHWTVRLALAASVVMAAAATYAGFEASEQLRLLAGFTF